MQGPTSSRPRPRDFFLSYDKGDVGWAEWIAAQLETAGYSTILQARDFRPGFNYIQEIHEASLVSRRTILLLSPEYLHELETHPEWSAALLRQVQGQKDALLPIRVHDCRPPGLLAPIITLDLYHLQDEDLARQALLDGLQIKRPEQKEKPSFPGRVSSVPIHQEDADAVAISPIFSPPYPQKLSPVHRTVQIFLAYAAEDESYAQELTKYLSELQRRGVIASWAKWNIQAGQEREKNILKHLEQADILLLLISAYFLSGSEVPLFEKQLAFRERSNQASIIPVLLRSSDWIHSPLGHLSPLPEGGKPIMRWKYRDEAFLNVVNGIRAVVEQIGRQEAPDEKQAR